MCRYEGLVTELDGMVEAGFIIPSAEELQVHMIVLCIWIYSITVHVLSIFADCASW